MNNYPLVVTLGSGSLLAFLLFFVFFKILHLGGKMAALATASLMLLIYVPLSVTHWVGIDVFAIHFAFFMMIPYGLGIITSVHEERRITEGEGSVKKGMHWIPALIIVFFILLAVVDSFIISTATTGLNTSLSKILLPKAESNDISRNISSRFTGAVSYDLQDEEKKFDQYVDKLQKQRERGWRIGGGWDKTPVINQPGTFRLTAKDKMGKPITEATVTTEFRRSSDMKQDRLIHLKETGQGVYSGSITLPLAGCWGMKIHVTKGKDDHEIRGETEVAVLKDGKLHIPECIDGEPDIDEKRTR